MNSVASPEWSVTRCPGAAAPTAVALLPVFNIPDRAIIAYEAIPRLQRAQGSVVGGARCSRSRAVHHARGALVPMFGDLLDTIG